MQSVYNDFLNTKLLYHKDSGVMFYHIVQSFPKGEQIDPQQAHEAARRLAEYFSGCEVLVCTHVDRDHIHSHCIVNSVNFETGKKLHMTDYEEYKQTGMLGSYHPEHAFLRKTDDGVQPVFRDAAYYYDEDAVIVERDMMVGKHCFHVTSIFPSQPTATATKKLLAYIDASIEKENR